MKFGFSGDAFGNLIILLTVTALIVIGMIFIIAKKRGVDVTTRSFQLRVGISCGIIFILIPLWFSDLSIKPKIIVTILGLAVGIGNYFAIDRLQKVLREQLGDKKKN